MPAPVGPGNVCVCVGGGGGGVSRWSQMGTTVSVVCSNKGLLGPAGRLELVGCIHGGSADQALQILYEYLAIGTLSTCCGWCEFVGASSERACDRYCCRSVALSMRYIQVSN